MPRGKKRMGRPPGSKNKTKMTKTWSRRPKTVEGSTVELRTMIWDTMHDVYTGKKQATEVKAAFSQATEMLTVLETMR